MTIFSYDCYKKYTLDWIKNQPKQGRGVLSAVARLLRTNSVTISQVFRGARNLKAEQGLLVSRFLGHDQLQEEYFLLLIQIARSETQDFSQHLNKKQSKLRDEAQNLKQRVAYSSNISDEARAIFYSNWEYGAVRLKAAIDIPHSPQQISDAIGIPLQRILEVLSFLKEHGLVTETNGKLQAGMASTHLDADSPFINNHRRNWWLQALGKLSQNKKENLFYSGPMTLSYRSAQKIRAILVESISTITKEIQSSKSDQTACLNIDWFEF